MASDINSEGADSDTSTVVTKFETRIYQIELIEQIKKMNAILFLPTGSGKTYIALEIIKHMQKDLAKPVSEGGKRTIFLVNQVALVEQHYSFLKRHCSLKITMLTGDVGVDMWNENDWKMIENDAQILIMTTQIYVNVLTHAYIYLKNANLIIFDECHHAVNNHPMKEVMTFFDNCDEKDHPKVLGLSATLLNANTTVLQFAEDLKTLEKTFRSKIITSTRVAEVKRFSTKAKEDFKDFTPYKPSAELRKRIDDMMKKYIFVLKNLKLKETVEIPEASDKLMNDRGENRVKLLKNCLSDLMVHLEEFGVYFCYIGCSSYILQLYRIMFEKSNEELYCNALLTLINLLKAIRKLLSIEIARAGDINDMNVVTKNSAEKLEYLLKQLNKLGPNDKCIVFVERRMTAKILSKIIEMSLNASGNELTVDFMIGFSVHPLRNSREGDFAKRCNKKVMNNFRSGKINVLVASNVLEEGIDMPDCNVVFMYDFPKTFRSYVQSKGRARKDDSTYVVLLDKDKSKNLKNIDDFRKLENELKNVVRTFDISRDENYEITSNEVEETYTTPANATITKTQSIALINLYCSSLPHDIFTQLTPYWWRNDLEEGCYCKLQFPMNAAIKEIIKGPVCSNIKEAKQAVAFEAVKMLHQMGVLNDNLMPILAPCQTQDEEYWFPNWVDEYQAGDGTKSSKREIDMKIPKYLQSSRPIPNKPCYLHVINIEAKYPKPELRRRERCHRLLTSKYELGILTRHPIPKICDFPVFSDLGEVEISIDTNHRTLILNEDEHLAASKFHRVLFLKAIQVVKKCLLYTNDDNAVGYFIVPLKPSSEDETSMEIAYDVIFDRWDIFDLKEPSERERREETFTKIKYWGTVLSPWYHKVDDRVNDKSPPKKKYFVVTDVDDNYTLQSPFPNPKYETFADFYKKVYNLDSLRPAQPMMEARPIPHNLDCLRPRVTSSDKTEKKRAKEQSIFMAPEFCMKQTFPAVIWYKSTVLPTILHRFHYLLLAEEIREKIVVEGGIGTLDWEKNEDDVLRVNEKYSIKKSKNKEPTPQVSNDKLTKTKTKDTKKKDTYSRRLAALNRAKKCLIKLLENDEDLPIDLDRSKNVTVKDIKKFLLYVTRNDDFCNDEQFSIKRAPSSSICERRLPNFEDAPKLMTLKEKSNYAGPRQKEIFEALTPAGCNDIVDLERLETLGDSFLKFAVSFTIYVKYNTVNEGYLTTLKGRLVGNRNLLYCGNKLQIGSFIKANTFSAQNNWCPPGFALQEILKEIPSKIDSLSPAVIFHVAIPYTEQFSGTISKNTVSLMKNDVKVFMDNESNTTETQKRERDALSFYNKQFVSDKTIADVMEALIGVYVKTGGIKPAYKLLNYFGILANPTYEDIMGTPVPSPKLEKSRLTVEDLVSNYDALERLLNYQFRDKSYIVQAVSHPSYLKNTMTDCYQTLEFIGDAVLDFLITSYIYQYCGNLPPGKLTDLRSSLVNNNTFGALCVRLGLHKFLLSNNKKLTDAINRFIEYQEQRDYEIHGNEMMVLISEGDVKIAEEVEVPKVLGDLFESIAGAIYLDSGNDLKTVWKTYYNIMKEEIKKFSENIPINPIRALYEEPGLKVKFLKETKTPNEDEKLRRFIEGKVEVPLMVKKGDKEAHYIGRGENTDLCKRAAAKLALRDFGRTEFVI